MVVVPWHAIMKYNCLAVVVGDLIGLVYFVTVLLCVMEI